jgi:hypothetical protein
MAKGPLDTLTPEQAKVVASLSPAQRQALAIGARCVRKRSSFEFLGLPLWSVATGPDPTRNEIRGHAKGVIAIGDIATGFIALGGWARGVFALGGLATGVFSFGGVAVGLLFALGGGAVSGGLAMGGGAVGTVAIGGGAIGHYAAGGGAQGTHVISPARTDPEAVAFFERWGLTQPAYRR